MLNELELTFHEGELVKLLQNIIRIKSVNPPGNEEELALFIQHYFKNNGIDAELSWAAPQRPNVIVRIKGKKAGPTMIYNGHLDTVPVGKGWTKDPFSGEIHDGRVYGRGASDMKSGVAAMMYAAIQLHRLGKPFDGTLILFFNVDEERSNIGMKKFLKENMNADFAVIGEPTDLDACIGHKGVGRYRIQTSGTAGHTAIIEHPDNAILKMAHIINALEQLGDKVSMRKHELLGNSLLTIAQIVGGDAPNIIPNKTKIEIDRRVMPGEKEENVFQEIKNTVSEVAKARGFLFDLEQYLYVPPYIIDQNHPLVETAVEVSSKITGKKKIKKPFLASAEAPFFAVERSIPTLILGPGSLSCAHIADEYVELSQVISASKIYTQLANQILRNGDGCNGEATLERLYND